MSFQTGSSPADFRTEPSPLTLRMVILINALAGGTFWFSLDRETFQLDAISATLSSATILLGAAGDWRGARVTAVLASALWVICTNLHFGYSSSLVLPLLGSMMVLLLW